MLSPFFSLRRLIGKLFPDDSVQLAANSESELYLGLVEERLPFSSQSVLKSGKTLSFRLAYEPPDGGVTVFPPVVEFTPSTLRHMLRVNVAKSDRLMKTGTLTASLIDAQSIKVMPTVRRLAVTITTGRQFGFELGQERVFIRLDGTQEVQRDVLLSLVPLDMRWSVETERRMSGSSSV